MRVIAFYLPQFHPIPENDYWWGKGFTEWTNVAKAKPLFPGHYQPHVPADLGFYDLRVPETRMAQADLAREFGIEGFCYWHYWFSGKRLLERPFNEVLKSREPDLPFCLAWANQSWTGIWHGAPGRILIEQTYPGKKDYEEHFNVIRDALCDDRYITVDGKPIFVVFYPYGLPNPQEFTDCWRELALKTGLKGIYFLGIAYRSWSPRENGLDGSILNNPASVLSELNMGSRNLASRIIGRLSRNTIRIFRKARVFPTIYSYNAIVKYAFPPPVIPANQFPCVVPNWDNTPRSGTNGLVFHDSSPDLFRQHLRQAFDQVAGRNLENQLVFVKSWNEWAEGNHLEPDFRYGKAYLEVIKHELSWRQIEHRHDQDDADSRRP